MKNIDKCLQYTPSYFDLMGENESSLPIYLMMNLDTKCTYACKKCALSKCRSNIGDKLTIRQQKEAIANAKEIGVKTLVIIGNGEPTENFPVLRELIGFANRLGLGSIIFTNGSNLDEEQAEFYHNNGTTLIFSLDSIDEQTYSFLTGSKKYETVMKNVNHARRIFRPEVVNGKKVVRLGINVTVVNQNVNQLQKLKDFAGNDMFFGANPPMQLGNIKAKTIWDRLVGENLPLLEKAAWNMSNAHGPSSIENNACSYFLKGISVDIDGQLLTCGYASETAGLLGNALDGKAAMLKSFEVKQQAYGKFSQSKKRKPCPIRDNFDKYVKIIKSNQNRS